MTSATERLRALLAERGVEWRGGLPTETMVEADGLDLLYVALPDGRVRAFIRNYLTPEQAVEATLGGDLQTENAKLRETLKVLMMGTNAELCADRNEADCRMCSMHHGEDGCTVVDAMELLGIDMYGMPLGVGVDG